MQNMCKTLPYHRHPMLRKPPKRGKVQYGVSGNYYKICCEIVIVKFFAGGDPSTALEGVIWWEPNMKMLWHERSREHVVTAVYWPYLV